jgi:predicted metal-dependent peptidase
MTTPDAATIRRISVARAQLLLNHPFFGMLALRLKVVDAKAAGHDVSKWPFNTMAVDGKNMYFNPDYVAKQSDKLLQSIVAHEVMHCALDHMGRRQARQPRRWNQACDYAVNPILEDAGLEVGKDWLNAPGFKNMTADAIYNQLPEDDKNGDNGHGEPLDATIDAPATDAAVNAAEWQVAVSQAAQEASKAGKLPKQLQRFVDEMLKPKVDWRAVMRRFAQQISRNDYNWSRPDKKFLAAGLYMPSLYTESLGKIAIGIDTSGSIDKKTLDAFNAEVVDIVSTARPTETDVYYCDARVAHQETFGPHDMIKLEPHGGGGTAFKPVFDAIAKKGDMPVCAIYLTDLYGEHNFPAPPYPVLWVCTSDVVGSFGETVKLELD